ncbi:site-specific DNA-methyltransferase [Candidatus Palauibacter sp.]|uniref:site-specific DNA-methyltransferase n=1 Tax=Candidatus Palauibacter sp. TaxID=3101350 RepID=UPI003B5C99AF
MTRRRSKAGRDIATYEHPDKERVNNPPVGLVTPETDGDAPGKSYAHDPHLDPEISWSGKAEHTSFEVPTVSLHVHERIDPRTIIEAVRKVGDTEEQGSLFFAPEENPPLRQAIEFYRHRHNWTNRLVAGDSLLVMNSLIEKEGLAGRVQMVYMDPPYGIDYGSNFQPFVNRRTVTDGRDEDLTQEPETIRAFRDTWELGIHSYLTYLRDRLLLCRELLADAGSIFMQINDENLSLVHLVMSEVFGAENFVVHIPFKKKGGQKGALLDPVNDFLIWFAKDKTRVREAYNQLFERTPLDRDLVETFRYVEFPDGDVTTLAKLEKRENRPDRYYRDHPDRVLSEHPGARIFKSENLTAGGFRKNQSRIFTYEGRDFDPGISKGNCWKHTVVAEGGGPSGMERLAAANRLYVGRDQIGFKRYVDDFGYKALSNWWDNLGGAASPIYVVQTNSEIVKRVLLMTTQPGDLVLDPTCGGGTTAHVAEEWGRRWITCDSSRVSLTLAKQRFMSSVFEYFQLAHSDEGVGGGFNYKTAPHVTSTDVANDQPPAVEILYDQPKIDRSKARVTGPFTVEAVPAPSVISLDEIDQGEALPADASVARTGPTIRQGDWRDELLKTGIRGSGGQHISFVRLEPLPGAKWLHADGETRSSEAREKDPADTASGSRVVVSFGPDHAPLEQRQVARAIEEASSLVPRPTAIVFAAFQFDPEASKDIDETNWPGVTLLKAQMNADLLTDDLKKKRTSNQGFWLIGQPDVALERIRDGEDEGRFRVSVDGFDYYNTETGNVESGRADRIAVWMLDPDYDGRSLFPRQVFFPMAGGNDGWAKLAHSLSAEIDAERMAAYRGTVSLPFEPGEHRRAAVKIVDDRGVESLKIVELT